MGRKNKQKQLEEADLPERGARPGPGALAAAIIGAIVVFGYLMLPRGGVVPPPPEESVEASPSPAASVAATPKSTAVVSKTSTPLPSKGSLPQGTAADPMLETPRPAMPVPCDSEAFAAKYKQAMADFYGGKVAEARDAFAECVKGVPGCALMEVAWSRSLLATGDAMGAREAADRAYAKLDEVDDRSRRIIYAWWWHMKGNNAPANEAKAAFEKERSILDYAIVLFPADPELWILRAVAAEGPVHAAPFYYLAKKLAPDHPAVKNWTKPTPPPVPNLPLVSIAALSKPEAPKLFDGLGFTHHKVSTDNELAQQYYDQGLRCFHSYVTPSGRPDSAARCFHYAIHLDPHLAMAYWGLSFCLGPGDAIKPAQAAASAYHLAMQFASDRERRLCAARVLELAGPQAREMFLQTLDGALAAYPEDVEIWIWRGKIYGQYGIGSDEEMTLSEKVLAGMPYELAAHLLAPKHPSPCHELIHTYEQIDRPALGWPFTFQYRDAAPNMPHANHMQAHLAMRLGRWDDALAAARRSVAKSREGFPELDPGHHLYVLALALAHEGRFQEAENNVYEARLNIAWARLLRLKSDQDGLRRWVDEVNERPTVDSLYVKVLVDLDDGRIEKAQEAFQVLEKAHKEGKVPNDYKLREARARILCATGKVEEGLKLFRATAWASVTDGSYHFFGGGGYFPEAWGEEALRQGKLDQAAVAFHEALAHEHGSIVAALGMQVVWERREKPDLAKHYADRAAKIWAGADPGFLERQLKRLRSLGTKLPPPAPLPFSPAQVEPFDGVRKVK